MKKGHLIIGAVILILLVVGASLILKPHKIPTKTNQTISPIVSNNSLEAQYPALINYDYLSQEVPNSTNVPLYNSTNGSLRFAPNETMAIYCGDTKAKEINFQSTHLTQEQINQGMVGGFSDKYIIDCGSSYWILQTGDAGLGPVYGPFYKRLY